MKNKDYGCKNTAYHTGNCCDTCWNKHPEATPDKMFLGSKRQKEIDADIFKGSAVEAGFTPRQALFLHQHLR
jgi:hypothetical protein